MFTHAPAYFTEDLAAVTFGYVCVYDKRCSTSISIFWTFISIFLDRIRNTRIEYVVIGIPSGRVFSTPNSIMELSVV